MRMTRAWLKEILEIVADITKFSDADAPRLRLFKNDVQPNVDTELGDFEEADFDGYTEKGWSSDDWNYGVDPVSGNQILEPKPTGASAVWEVTGETDIPQTVYGFYLTDNAGTTLIGARRFNTPVVLTGPATGKVVRLDAPVEFQFNAADIK